MQKVSITPFRFTAARTSILGVLVCAAFLTGCDGGSEPVGPITPGPQLKGAIAGQVIDESAECIIGARVELIDGPQAGAVFVQTSCGWDYSTGYLFSGLPRGLTMTVRATAKGYLPAETLARPTNPSSYTTMIVLKKEN
jgi:hypothetical protein